MGDLEGFWGVGGGFARGLLGVGEEGLGAGGEVEEVGGGEGGVVGARVGWWVG